MPASLSAIHRYPVKSLLGESLEETWIGAQGLPGDRAWAVRDGSLGEIQGAKKIPELMSLAAHYPEGAGQGGPGAGQLPAPVIQLPGGQAFRADDPQAAKELSAELGKQVSIQPPAPAEDLEFYRRKPAPSSDPEGDMRRVFARTPDEPLPDLAAFPREVLLYESPPGTFFDAFPLLLMSEESLESLARSAPDSRIDLRRFRPNLLVAAPNGERFPELAWVGRRLRVGTAVLQVDMACPRCVMTTHAFADLPKDPGIMRKLVREAEGNLGVYASVETPGRVAIGDAVLLVEEG